MSTVSVKEFIKNREGQRVAVLVNVVPMQKGLAFVMHGLGGFKELPQVAMFAEAFIESGYTAVRFDTTNTLGESDGKYEDATVSNYYEDLEDVIGWSRREPWYEEPFCLIGHSLGGICTALYAERHPQEVKGLAPLSTVVSGELSIEATPKETLKEWKRLGWQERRSRSRGIIIWIKWSHMEDRLKYDLLPHANKLTMPVLMAVGDRDDLTPLQHQHILYDRLPGPKEIHVIKDNAHTFYDRDKMEELKRIIKRWIAEKL